MRVISEASFKSCPFIIVAHAFHVPLVCGVMDRPWRYYDVVVTIYDVVTIRTAYSTSRAKTFHTAPHFTKSPCRFPFYKISVYTRTSSGLITLIALFLGYCSPFSVFNAPIGPHLGDACLDVVYVDVANLSAP